MEKEWYVVNTYSGHENKVKEKLEMRASSMGMEDYIYRVVVPAQKEVVVKNGKEVEKESKMFPGYILVEMVMTDEAWFIVRNTPGVTGFIGSSGKGAKPFPVPKEQIESVLKKIGIVNLDMYASYVVGAEVKILKGPLIGATGVIQSVDTENGVVKVAAMFFGRQHIVDIPFQDVEKIEL